MTEDEKVLERDYGVICEIHKNNTNWVVPESAGLCHLHCRPVEESERRIWKVIEAIGECENSKGNGYGIFCWARDKQTNESIFEYELEGRDFYRTRRHLCEVSDQEAKKEITRIFWRYLKANGEMKLSRAIEIYSPSYENNTARHAYCISQKSGVPLNTDLRDLLTN